MNEYLTETSPEGSGGIKRISEMEKPPRRAVLVVGGGLTDLGTLNDRSRVNVEAAVAAAVRLKEDSNFQEVAFIFAGGYGPANAEEGPLMARHFKRRFEQVNNGSSTDSPEVFYENKSLDTKGNLEKVHRQLEQAGYKKRRMLVIGDQTHSQRIRRLARLSERSDGNFPGYMVCQAEQLLMVHPDKEVADKVIKKYHQSPTFKMRKAAEMLHPVFRFLGLEQRILDKLKKDRGEAFKGSADKKDGLVAELRGAVSGPRNLPKERLATEAEIEAAATRLGEADIPVLTLGGSKKIGGFLSAGHDVMQRGFIEAAEEKGLDAYGVDAIDMINTEEERQALAQMAQLPRMVVRSELGSKMLHHPLVQKMRSGLGLEDVVADKVLRLVDQVDKRKPIVLFHYGAAKVLVENGYNVIMAVTDPSSDLTHEGYISFVNENPRYQEQVRYAVMDEATAFWLNQYQGIPRERIKNVGAFVSPEVVEAGKQKISAAEKRWSKEKLFDHPVRLAVFTGGLGTNIFEIKKLIKELSSWMHSGRVELNVFLGTNLDLRENLRDYAASECGLQTADTEQQQTYLNLVAGQDKQWLAEKSKEFLKWADLVVTKPSGDKGFEACAAGCPLLSLFPLHPHEIRIYKILRRRGAAVRAEIGGLKDQLIDLVAGGKESELVRMIKNTHYPEKKHLPYVDLNGCRELVDWYESIAF
jgi:hypothetical protein